MLGGKDGIDLVNRSLEIKRNVYGEDHPEIAENVYTLSDLYYDLGDIHKAKKMAQEAFLLLQDTRNTSCK